MQLFSQIETKTPTLPYLIDTETVINSTKEEQLNFTAFPIFSENKSYIPITGRLFDHITTTKDLSNIEKIYYLLINSLAFISSKNNQQRSTSLSSKVWAKLIGCSRSQVFTLQQSLEKKGYLIITKNKNRYKQNKRNLLTPTLPDILFKSLRHTPDIIGIKHLDYVSSCESKLEYLDRTKLFIPVNYHLLKIITSNLDLSSLQKVIWLDFYSKCYKYHISSDKTLGFSFITSYEELMKRYSCSKVVLSKVMNILENNNFITKKRFFCKKDIALEDRQDKSLWHITLTLPASYSLELTNIKDRANLAIEQNSSKEISNKQTNHNDNFDNNYLDIVNSGEFGARRDGAIPISNRQASNDDVTNFSSIDYNKIPDLDTTIIVETIALVEDSPINTVIQIASEITVNKTLEICDLQDRISNSDPHFIKSRPHISKYFKSNIKDLDNINNEKIFFKKVNVSLPKTSSELSVSYKNSLEEKNPTSLDTITEPQTTNLEISNNSEKQEEIKTIEQQDIITFSEEFNQQVTAKEIENTNNLLITNEHLAKLAYTEKFEEDASPRTTAYSNVGEDLSTASLSKLPAEIDFCKRSTEKIPNATPTSTLDNSSSQDTYITQGKSLKSFYPLTNGEVDKINQLSGREFSNNFANQLLLKLYIRDPNKTFASTNHMISYMIKAFRYEKHQAPMVNHETFRFTANVSDPESVEMRQKEKYLREVEYSMDTSCQSQLRKKISGMFETKLAYRILTEGEFDYHTNNDQTTIVNSGELEVRSDEATPISNRRALNNYVPNFSSIDYNQELEITNDICQNLELSEENNVEKFDHVAGYSTCFADSSLSLSSKHDVTHIDYDNQLSINFTKSGLVITENDYINVNILTRELSELSLKPLLTRQFVRITLANTCTVKLPKDLILTNNQQQNLEKAISAVYGYVKIVYHQLPATCKKLGSSRLSDEIFLIELNPNSVWYKIRKKLIDNFDEHIDKAWFSKLRAEEDESNNIITLYAPSNFIRDYVNNKYGYLIKQIAKQLDYQFVELVTKKIFV